MPPPRPVLLVLVAASLGLPGVAADTFATQCDPALGAVCVHDRMMGEGCLGSSGVGETRARVAYQDADGGASGWRTCSADDGRLRTTNAVRVGMTVGVTGAWVVWRQDDADRRFETSATNDVAGQVFLEWSYRNGACFLGADARPLWRAHRSETPGCVAGSPPTPPGLVWGALVP